MAVIPDKHVWVFNGARGIPGGVFSTLDRAEAWILQHRLSGILTCYPLDEGCFDWAFREGVTNLKAEKRAIRQFDAEFIANFSTASQEHYHYENGIRF